MMTQYGKSDSGLWGVQLQFYDIDTIGEVK